MAYDTRPSYWDSIGLSPLTMPDPRLKAILDAQAQAKQDFANIREGKAGPAPAMSEVTSNPMLLANDERSSQLGQLRDTLAAMNPTPRTPETILPSRAAQTGAYGAGAYQSDRNARLAILNEQERNRQPTTALKEHTINLDTLPDQLKQVYAQRTANEGKRNALVASGALKPLVAPEIASPEKVRADKQRRAEEEAYRQGNWSLIEQARNVSRKLGINPMVATAMVADRMQQGAPVGSDNEPRMPASWEPRLRSGSNNGLMNDIMQSALLGPQGAAHVQVTNAQQTGATERSRLDNSTRSDLAKQQGESALAQILARGQQEMPLLLERGRQNLEAINAQGNQSLKLTEQQNRVRTELEKMGIDAKTQQIVLQGLQNQDLAKQQAQLQDQNAANQFERERGVKLPLADQLEGQQIEAERAALAELGQQAPPDRVRRLQMREEALRQKLGGAANPSQSSMYSPQLDSMPDIRQRLDNFITGTNAPSITNGPDNWTPWSAGEIKPRLDAAVQDLIFSGVPPEMAKAYAGQWMQRKRDESWLPFLTATPQSMGY